MFVKPKAMNKKQLLILFSLALLSATSTKKQRIVFFGDSIVQRASEDKGYLTLIQKRIDSLHLQNKYELINAGVGGEKVYDLYFRLDSVLEKKPDVVVISVGVNDIFHKTANTGTDIVTYEKFYTAIIKKLQAQNIKVVLCTLTVIGEQKEDSRQYRALDIYSEVVRRLARIMNCGLVDQRTAFLNYEEANNKSNLPCCLLTTDWMHLSDAGNKLVAEEMLKVIDIK